MAAMSFDKSMTTGHGNFPPTVVNATQSKVFVTGIAALVTGDQITPHTRTSEPYDTHSGSVEGSTGKVFISGKKAIQIADSVTCGDTVSQGSSKVFING